MKELIDSDTVEIILGLSERGFSARRVAEALDNMGIEPPRGGGSWNHKTIVVLRQRYEQNAEAA